jgi:Flp pilus assembly protein TadG
MVMPMLLMFLLGAVQYGRMIWTTQALQAAAQETARCVAIGSSACPAPSSYAVTLASGYGVVGLTASGVAVVNTPSSTTSATACNPPSGSSTVFTRVTLTVPFTNPVGSLLSGVSPTIVQVACYPIGT